MTIQLKQGLLGFYRPAHTNLYICSDNTTIYVGPGRRALWQVVYIVWQQAKNLRRLTRTSESPHPLHAVMPRWVSVGPSTAAPYYLRVEGTF